VGVVRGLKLILYCDDSTAGARLDIAAVAANDNLDLVEFKLVKIKGF
jgi:hypothetical protein